MGREGRRRSDSLRLEIFSKYVVGEGGVKRGTDATVLSDLGRLHFDWSFCLSTLIDGRMDGWISLGFGAMLVFVRKREKWGGGRILVWV